MRVYAIGDVHGELGLLAELLTKLDKDDMERGPADTHLIFLGDLIDRGPASAEVIEYAMLLARTGQRVRFLMGNHEEVFLRAATGDPKMVRFFQRIGGRETLESYGIARRTLKELETEQLAQKMQDIIPESHVEFLRDFENAIVIGDYVFVHAGIRPGIPLDEQTPYDLRWIRSDFTEYSRPHDKMVVHGHTISEEIEELPNRIGIDTGAFQSGRLTAVGLEGDDRWFIQAGNDKVA